MQTYMEFVILVMVQLERQHKQEMQSQFVGNRWSITQTKTASLVKG